MKSFAVISLGLVAATHGFAPLSQGRAGTELQESLMSKVFGLDLFAPVKDQNDYGARSKKNVSLFVWTMPNRFLPCIRSHTMFSNLQIKIGEIKTGTSYIPNGLTAAQYNKVRAAEVAKKKARYEVNVKKAGIFEDFTDWYTERGTDEGQGWAKSVTNGHRMVKTKFDWTGDGDKKNFASEAKKGVKSNKSKPTEAKKGRKLFGKVF
jgi:hypothetical protein